MKRAQNILICIIIKSASLPAFLMTEFNKYNLSSFSISRFINARRRIVQPMIDQSNRAGKHNNTVCTHIQFFLTKLHVNLQKFSWQSVSGETTSPFSDHILRM